MLALLRAPATLFLPLQVRSQVCDALVECCRPLLFWLNGARITRFPRLALVGGNS